MRGSSLLAGLQARTCWTRIQRWLEPHWIAAHRTLAFSVIIWSSSLKSRRARRRPTMQCRTLQPRFANFPKNLLLCAVAPFGRIPGQYRCQRSRPRCGSGIESEARCRDLLLDARKRRRSSHSRNFSWDLCWVGEATADATVAHTKGTQWLSRYDAAATCVVPPADQALIMIS